MVWLTLYPPQPLTTPGHLLSRKSGASACARVNRSLCRGCERAGIRKRSRSRESRTRKRPIAPPGFFVASGGGLGCSRVCDGPGEEALRRIGERVAVAADWSKKSVCRFTLKRFSPSEPERQREGVNLLDKIKLDRP